MLSPHDVSMLRARLVVAQKESEERGDSAPDLLMPEMLRAPYPGWRVYLAELHNADTLDEIDALQARLAAAEAERNEWKDIASVFLAATEPNQPIPVQGQIMLAQVRERARSTFDASRAALRGDARAKEE